MSLNIIFPLIISTILVFTLTPANGCGMTKYYVKVHNRSEIQLDAAKKLSPILIAVEACQGQLIGADVRGNPIIACDPSRKNDLLNSPAVKEASEEIPVKWIPVTQIKLSYQEEPFTEEELKQLEMRMIGEPYEKGRFMTVEPLKQPITSHLVQQISQSQKLRYATPVIRANVLR